MVSSERGLRHRSVTGLLCVLWGAACGLGASMASPPTAEADEVQEGPLAAEEGAVRALEVHVGLAFPVEEDAVCPPDAACILGPGGGIGALIERRWATGLAFGVGYDVWFLDGAGVYELGILQQVRGVVRLVMLADRRVHPILEAGVGILAFGDTIEIATLGGALLLGMGGEVELTESIALTAMLTLRFFALADFTTPADRVNRGGFGDINAALGLQLGLAVFD